MKLAFSDVWFQANEKLEKVFGKNRYTLFLEATAKRHRSVIGDRPSDSIEFSVSLFGPTGALRQEWCDTVGGLLPFVDAFIRELAPATDEEKATMLAQQIESVDIA